MFAAATHAGLTARLALATLYQMGELEDGYDYGSRSRRGSRGYEDPDSGTMGEICDESFELDHWRDARDRKLTLGPFPLNPDEVITAEDFSTIDPDEKAGEGYTGNAGCTMEYWYRRAAVVLWPEGRDEEILCAKNLPEACAKLLSLSFGKKIGNGTPFDKLARAAIPALAAASVSGKWHYPGIDKELKRPVSQVLHALSQAKRRDLLDELLRAMPGWTLGASPQTLWKALFTAFEPDAFAPVFQEILADADRNREALFTILAAFMADPAAREHPIRRRQDERVAAEEFIKRHFLDLDCQTLRQGTPHTLLCTKNDCSYQHALEWRKKDEEMLRKLEAL